MGKGAVTLAASTSPQAQSLYLNVNATEASKKRQIAEVGYSTCWGVSSSQSAAKDHQQLIFFSLISPSSITEYLEMFTGTNAYRLG